ncbi:MAG: ribonuclease J, partial [Dehalococcoidia bacterium]|nr:ribonuclease J [Dehalococcoidia bacterium]
DRAHLSTDGVVVVIVNVEKQTGKLTSAPELLSRGFVDAEGHELLLEEGRDVVARALQGADHITEIADTNATIRDSLSKFLYDQTRRRPMVLAVTVEV